MKERPIIMQGESVRAILAGRKTQTRRADKHLRALPPITGWGNVEGNLWRATWQSEAVKRQFITTIPPDVSCPYGVPGDRLWVKEGFACTPKGTPFYRADLDHDENLFVVGGWKSPLFMPRRFSRLTLEITDVRVQRVQDIRCDDCEAEGIVYDPDAPELGPCGADHDTNLMERFEKLWDSVNAKRGYSWDSNPWVWCLTFKTVEGAK